MSRPWHCSPVVLGLYFQIYPHSLKLVVTDWILLIREYIVCWSG